MQILIVNAEWVIGTALIILLVAALAARSLARYLIKTVFNSTISKLLSEKYTQNVAELLPSLKRFSVLNALELSLRAEEGKIIARPLGSPKHYLGFENLMFTPHQMKQLSLPAGAPVDVQVTLGSQAKKPLTVDIPLIISSMAYGLALTADAKMALANAAKRLGTALGSGEGPALPGEGQTAGKYILQITRWDWGLRTDEEIATASMLEVQMGQGADMGTAFLEAAELAGRAGEIAGLAPGQSTESLAAPPGVTSPEDWPEFMEKLRKRANGIPIALKIMATDSLEEDLSVALELGFDAIIIDGAQGGSHASPPIKQDDFGMPTLHALIRARRYLGNSPVSLIIAGGFFTPGQCLKALALGADAVYMGSVPLFALAHNQSIKVTPFEPLTTLVYYDAPSHPPYDVETASTYVTNVLTSMVLEMQEALRALGKASLAELGPDDLVALDQETARVTGVREVCAPAPVPTVKGIRSCRKIRAKKLKLQRV